MSTTKRQWSHLRMLFHANRAYPASMDLRDVSFLAVDSPDVIQCTIHKDINQAAGGFTATLVPRQDYLSNIRPNDWVELYLDNGDGAPEPVMVASVDRVARRRVTDQKGSTSEVITITGRDYGKVFLNTVIIIDPLVGSIIDQTTFDQEVIVSQYGANNIPLKRPDQVIQALLERYHDKRAQCLLPSSLLKHGDLSTRLSAEVRGRIVPNGNPNLSGNLWTTMEQYINPVLNEFWVDTIDGVPTLTLEERPYSHDNFANLDALEVEATDVPQEDTGKSDDDTRNWLRLYPDAQYLPAELVNIAGLGYSNRYSMARSGLRKLEMTTNAFGEFHTPLVNVDQGIPSGLLQEWVGTIAEWNVNNDQLLSGSMTMRLRPDARVGMRLDYTNLRSGERTSFYLESVTHNFTYPGASTTSVTVTRGVTRDRNALKFPQLKSLEQLRLEDDLQLLTQLNLQALQKAEDDNNGIPQGLA